MGTRGDQNEERSETCWEEIHREGVLYQAKENVQRVSQWEIQVDKRKSPREVCNSQSSAGGDQ